MKTIEIITHCYAEEFPAFASLLTAQLSSLVLWPPNCPVQVSVCGAGSDQLTMYVVAAFGRRMLRDKRQNVRLQFREFSKPELFRRGFGRNKLFKETRADIVWAADADYVFGPDCLDTLARTEIKHNLVYPQDYWIHRGHGLGDREISLIIPGEVFIPDLSLFQACHVGFAIGGLQIVPGDEARKGYLDGSRWSAAEPNATRFQDTKEDKKYRTAAGGSQPINLPNLYRMRHSCSAFQTAEERLRQTAGKA